uniref:Uncharacterized protein n=1 Tax=Prolemur simus TaxID=1328070 RepID=A0A8C8YXW3_PROSS
VQRESGLRSRPLALRLSGFSERGAARQPRITEEQGLEIYDWIRTIRDPEKPNTPEELEMVTEGCVETTIWLLSSLRRLYLIALWQLTGLCLRAKLQRRLPFKRKLEIYISRNPINRRRHQSTDK